MPIIGIDLGTTNSVVAVHEGKQTTVIVNNHGARLTPSVVAYLEDGTHCVGQTARNQSATNPQNTVASIKRFMGRRHSEVNAEEKIVPYKVVGGPEELVRVDVRGHAYSPPEISAVVLQDLKASAQKYLGSAVRDAVITVPAYFNDSQRQATKEAGEIAGLAVKRIINEPTAAALAYGLQEKVTDKKRHRVAVFDLGGGTFDISILDIGDGIFEVLSTNGDTHLGGDDWDRILVDFVADEFRKSQGIDLRADPMALQRLVEACERAKCILSTMPQASINLPYITADKAGPKHLQTTLTRATFEELTKPLFDRLGGPVLQCIQDAKIAVPDIAEVVLVGGSTRMPKVVDICKSLFSGKQPNQSVNPDEVVAVGAAIQGAIMGGDVKDIVLLDVTPLSLGVETLGGINSTVIPRNSTIPTQHKELYTTASDMQPAVDIHVVQGERRMVQDCRTLGRFQLAGVTPAPRGVPQIEVNFDIDVNGILNVSALDKATGKEQKIEIKSSSGLSKEEVARLTTEAKTHEEDDAKRAAAAEARNKADYTCYQAERLLAEQKGKIPPGYRENAEKWIKAVRDAALTMDKAKIDEMLKGLEGMMMEIGTMLTNAAKASEPTPQPTPQPTPTTGPPKTETT